MAKKKKSSRKKKAKRLFVALPSKILEESRGLIDEYKKFVELLRLSGFDVVCPLEDVGWTTRKPRDPDRTIRKRLTDIERADAIVALPVVEKHKSSGVMGYVFYAAAKSKPTFVYLRGSGDLDVPWQLVGLRDCEMNLSVVHYRSNLLLGLRALQEAILGESWGNEQDGLINESDEGNPFGESYIHYWRNRKQLLTKWDDGIQSDEQGICSVKPESIALEIARELKGDVVLDAFCGIGGNSIAFAREGKKVICFETNAKRLEMARCNARLYGVESRIKFVEGDFFSQWKSVVDDVESVYFDPSWGGPSYVRSDSFRFIDFDPDGNGDVRTLLHSMYLRGKNIAISLPKNFDTRQLTDLHRELSSHETDNDRQAEGLRMNWHSQGTRVLFLTAYL